MLVWVFMWFTSLVSMALVWAPESQNTYDSIIVTKIETTAPQQYDEIIAAVGHIDQLNIEYYCKWSGVLILKLNGSVLHESGDIHLYIKNVLLDASSLKKVDIMHVHTGLSGIAKC